MFYGRQEFKKLQKLSLKSGAHLLRDYLSKKKGRVLDFGCGKGTFKPHKGIQYFGYDIDKTNKLADYHALKEIKDVFDVVVLSHVVEHMAPEELEKTLEWLSRHAREIVIITPASTITGISFFNDITHVKPYSNPDALFLIEKYFRIQNYYYCGLHTLNPIKIFLRSLLAYALNTYPLIEFTVFAKNKRPT